MTNIKHPVYGGQYKGVDSDSRFTGVNTLSALPKRKPPKLLIKGSITALGEGEFSTDLVYSFKISPLGQDRNGNDRVFTFINYCKAEDRNSETGSEARRRIAHSLRKRHALLWSNFHEAYD